MQYVIIDMEFNRFKNKDEYCTNHKEEKSSSINEEDCPNEIIQIGAVKLNAQMKTVETLKLYIKPTIYPFINPIIKELTGITEEDLHNGVSFVEALHKLRKFIGEGSVFCSWAKDDIVELIRNAHYHKCGDISWIHSYLDIQEYCTKILASKHSLSLKNAIKRFSIKVDESELHDGLNDALYTAEVFRRSFNSKAIKNYIIRDISNMPSVPIEIDENYKLKQENIELCCPKCKREVTSEYPLKAMKWRFVGVGYCECCKINIMQEVVVKKSLVGDEIYKTSNRILDEEEYISITGRLEKIS